MVDKEGFEPSIQLPAYTLSRRAPSATRPSIQLVLYIYIIKKYFLQVIKKIKIQLFY